MNRRTLLLFLVTSLLFGTSFVGIKAGLASVPPVLFAAVRLDIGALVLLAYLAGRDHRLLPRTRAEVLSVAVSAAFVVVASNVLLFLGQVQTTSGAAAVMYSLLPVAAPVFAVFLLADERVSWDGGVGLLLGLVGVAVIARPPPDDLAGTGQVLVVLAAVSVALGSVLLRRLEATLPTFALTAWAMALGAPVVHATSLALGEPQSVALTPGVIAAVLYVGVPATAVAYPAYFALLAEAGPVRGNLVAYSAPVVATLAGWLVLDETVSPTTGLGFLFVFAGFALLQRDALARLLRNRGLVPARRLVSDGGRTVDDERSRDD